MGISTELEYLSDGLTEELIAGLTGNERLRVAPRTSSFYFKDMLFSLEEISEKPKVTILWREALGRVKTGPGLLYTCRVSGTIKLFLVILV